MNERSPARVCLWISLQKLISQYFSKLDNTIKSSIISADLGKTFRQISEKLMIVDMLSQNAREYLFGERPRRHLFQTPSDNLKAPQELKGLNTTPKGVQSVAVVHMRVLQTAVILGPR